ncbi:hypothetical protein QNA24_28050 [Rhodococcus qingshengii]|uniref:hypothetical protein n=1 Tax=Rhodococcus qingshengii TaxID=334542 RepID=UPI0024BA1F3F|nr:hypothetical protein [Rhodococcus qingshengii]MDJ0490236.1 hypothetical protein [Rhodococcus qingshengii]
MTKIAVGTGAGRRIGRAATSHLVREGWTVCATVRSEAHMNELFRLSRVVPIVLDITAVGADEILRKRILGRVDVLCT